MPFQPRPSGGGGGAPSGPAGGGLSGTYPNPGVNAQGPVWTYTSGSVSDGTFKPDNVEIDLTTGFEFSTLTKNGTVNLSDLLASIAVGSRLVLTSQAGDQAPFIVNSVTGGATVTFGVTIAVGAAPSNWASEDYYLTIFPAVQTSTQIGLGNVTNDVQLKASDLDTDGTLAGNSDTKVASQKATKTYADTKLALGGDGSTITNLTATNLNGIVSVANGGTGLNSITAGDLFYAASASIFGKLAIPTTACFLVSLSGTVPSWQTLNDNGWTANADVGDKSQVIPASATIAAMQAALNLVVAGFGDSFVAVAAKVKALETVLAGNQFPNA